MVLGNLLSFSIRILVFVWREIYRNKLFFLFGKINGNRDIMWKSVVENKEVRFVVLVIR